MNTERSQQIVDRFRERSYPGIRKKAEWSHLVSGRPEDVFPLLCPSREADWIPGWTPELIYTESGYAEEACVFRTEMASGTGPGVWVFTRHEEPVLVEIVRFNTDVLTQIRASLEEVEPSWEGGDPPSEGGDPPSEGGDPPSEGGDPPVEGAGPRLEGGELTGMAPESGGEMADPRTRVRWEYVLTGLTEAGREIVDGMEAELGHKAKSVGVALNHYLRTGEMIGAG